MERYIDSKGRPIAFNGREIKEGDTIVALIGGLDILFSVTAEGGALTARREGVESYLRTICKGAERVEITNR